MNRKTTGAARSGDGGYAPTATVDDHGEKQMERAEIRFRGPAWLSGRDRGVRASSSQQGWSTWQRFVKRLMDILFSLVGLALTLLLAPCIALAIRWNDGGHVLYRQRRVGLNGRIFQLWKFRTMAMDAEEKTGARWADLDDPRVTAVGRFLRATHLDELPQFWSVLRGDMSLVGPRPERPEMVAMLARKIPGYDRRTAVRPGITGPAQLRLGYVNTVETSLTKLKFDLAYIASPRLATDVHCILRTMHLTLTDLFKVCSRALTARFRARRGDRGENAARRRRPDTSSSDEIEAL